MNANESTINRILLQLCKFGNYTIHFIKLHNVEKDYIYTKHILKKGREEDYYSYSKRTFVMYIYDLWQKEKQRAS